MTYLIIFGRGQNLYGKIKWLRMNRIIIKSYMNCEFMEPFYIYKGTDYIYSVQKVETCMKEYQCSVIVFAGDVLAGGK